MRSLCGFAASRAESLWLSVALQRGRGFASGGVAAKSLKASRKAGGFPHGKRQSRRSRRTGNGKAAARDAAKPQITSYFFLRHLR